MPQFLQTNDLVLKFCDDCLAGRSSQEGSRDNKSIFQSSWSFSNKYQRSILHLILSLKKRKKRPVLNKSPVLKGVISSWHNWIQQTSNCSLTQQNKRKTVLRFASVWLGLFTAAQICQVSAANQTYKSATMITRLSLFPLLSAINVNNRRPMSTFIWGPHKKLIFSLMWCLMSHEEKQLNKCSLMVRCIIFCMRGPW